MPPLILASTSAYRRELMSRLRLPFEVEPPQIEETAMAEETPLARVQRLALSKASAVSARRSGAVVIGSDQLAVCKGELLEKPGDAEHCRQQLQWLSASMATFYTAVALIGTERSSTQQFLDTTAVYFRALSEGEIRRYIEADQPFDCAGGFRSERLGVSLFARVVSEDPTALIGLPLIALARGLRQLGYELP